MIDFAKANKITDYFPNTLNSFARHFATKYHIYLICMILVDCIVIVYLTMQPYIFKKIIDAATVFLGKPNFIKEIVTPCVILITINLSSVKF